MPSKHTTSLFTIVFTACLLTVAPAAAHNVPEKTAFSTSSVVYLTFDADMTPRMKRELQNGSVKQWYDPALITYLEQNHIPATIFVTGMFAEIYPQAVTQWGHNPLFKIGNHSYSHPGFTTHCYHLATVTTTAEKISQITRTQTILEKDIGYYPTLFRFPGLCHTVADDQLVKKQGLTPIDATDISGDAFASSSTVITTRVMKHLHANAIILMHTGGPHAPATTATLEKLVPLLEKEGYHLEKLTF